MQSYFNNNSNYIYNPSFNNKPSHNKNPRYNYNPIVIKKRSRITILIQTAILKIIIKKN